MWYPPTLCFWFGHLEFKELTLQKSQFSQLVSGLFLLLFDIDNFLGSIPINQNLQFTFFNMETLSQKPFLKFLFLIPILAKSPKPFKREASLGSGFLFFCIFACFP